MRNPLCFFGDLAKQPLWVSVWVAILALVNVASVFFWSETLARVIFGVFIISAILMMTLYSLFGFQKILGLGHVVWVFLLPYVVTNLDHVDRGFSFYLIVFVILTTVSLVFDFIDVWRYLRDNRG